MLKKTIRYTDFNDKEVEQTCYFHLGKAELMEMEMSKEGGLQEYLKRIIASEDGRAIMEEFKKLVLRSYGKRTADGSGFIKNDELRDQFYASAAYDALFMELCTNAEAAAEFVNGIVPSNLEKEMAKLTTSAGDEAKRVHDLGKNEGPAEETNVFENEEAQIHTLTPAEILSMDGEDLKSGLASGKYRMP